MAKKKADKQAMAKPPLDVEDGSSFGWFDRIGLGMSVDGKFAVDLSDWAARDMHEMLTRDYKAVQIEKVLSLPIQSAKWSIQPGRGDTGQAKWLTDYWDTDGLSGGCTTSLEAILGLMTSAFSYKHAYFELVYTLGKGPFEGKIVYDDVAWRPQTTCRLMRHPRTGRQVGFQQQAYFLGGVQTNMDKWPIQIEGQRAFIFTNGTRRDPVNGHSDMEVAYWAWKTKQKLLLLWFQFLQGVALPRTIVKANDIQTASQVAREVAKLKSSGVLPVAQPGGPDSVAIESLDLSGKGAEQFTMAISWLDRAATESVLAGFLDLTGGAATGTGSYALSKDASDFFLQSLTAKSKEIADQVRSGLFAPLIRANFGPDASIPKLVFEPLNDIDKEASISLLQSAMAAPPGGPVPTSFVSELAGQVATYLGLDGDTTAEEFKKSFDAAAAQAQAKALADNAGLSPAGQQVAGIAGAVGAAKQAVDAGLNAKATFKAQKKEAAKQAATVQKGHAERTALLSKHAKNTIEAKTGGRATL